MIKSICIDATYDGSSQPPDCRLGMKSHVRGARAKVIKFLSSTDTELVWRWNRKKLRNAWFQEGAYLLRTNLQEHDPEKLWRQYMQLIEIEAVFRTLKSELNLRPVFHRIQSRVEAHILIAFLAYCLWVAPQTKASFPRW